MTRAFPCRTSTECVCVCVCVRVSLCACMRVCVCVHAQYIIRVVIQSTLEHMQFLDHPDLKLTLESKH